MPEKVSLAYVVKGFIVSPAQDTSAFFIKLQREPFLQVLISRNMP